MMDDNGQARHNWSRTLKHVCSTSIARRTQKLKDETRDKSRDVNPLVVGRALFRGLLSFIFGKGPANYIKLRDKSRAGQYFTGNESLGKEKK